MLNVISKPVHAFLLASSLTLSSYAGAEEVVRIEGQSSLQEARRNPLEGTFDFLRRNRQQVNDAFGSLVNDFYENALAIENNTNDGKAIALNHLGIDVNEIANLFAFYPAGALYIRVILDEYINGINQFGIAVYHAGNRTDPLVVSTAALFEESGKTLAIALAEIDHNDEDVPELIALFTEFDEIILELTYETVLDNHTSPIADLTAKADQLINQISALVAENRLQTFLDTI